MKLVILIWATLLGAHAEDSCVYKDIREYKKKLFSSNPVLDQVKLQKDATNSFVDKAKQRPNPALEFEYTRGDDFGLDTNNYDLKLLHVIEMGGKRSARMEQALARAKLESNQYDLYGSRKGLENLLKYQRGAQLEVLVKAMQEAIETFRSLIKKLGSRKRLNPEEKVSLSTLKLALNDYTARLNDFKNEQDVLAGEVAFMGECKKLKFNYTPIKYPNIGVLELSEKQGMAAIEENKVEVARKLLKQEKSLAYPDLMVGPIVGYETKGADEFVSAGIGITFNAPFLNTNYGGKLQASKNLLAQQKIAKNNISLLKRKLNNQLKVYHQSLKTYQAMPSLSKIAKFHNEAEQLFRRGVVSIPMIIESHRQYVDYMDSRFETENDILNALMEIYIITGKKKLIEKLFN